VVQAEPLAEVVDRDSGVGALVDVNYNHDHKKLLSCGEGGSAGRRTGLGGGRSHAPLN
jgi:hypothetical protein